MHNSRIPERISARRSISQNQKAWKYIQDVNHQSIADLSRIALEDGRKQYTYGLMFREWERYASVFSALGMTGEKHSRTGILGSTCAEAIFSIYGLNMVGADVSIVPAYSALIPRKIMETIRSEHLTDFIITDDFAQINIMHELLLKRDELGLNNIIILHVPVAGATVNHALRAAQESKYAYLKFWVGPICMDELLKAYGDYPVQYAPEESSDTAFILHTSGTTSGAGKPVTISDRAFNAAAATFYELTDLQLPWEHLVTAVIVDLSNAYGMVDQVHLPFAMGAAVVTAPGGILNPMFYKAIPHHGITFLFTVSAMFERWMKRPEKLKLDFSSLKFAVLGGASVSAADKHRYAAFLKEHGAGDVTLLNGYGISELSGACCLSTPDLDDEAIGYPLPDVNVRLYDEERNQFLSASDAPCEGILYLNSPAIATSSLDERLLFETESLDGNAYVCTNDLARMDADGKLTFLGRANRYYIHAEGSRFEAGRVETEFARQEGIETCCVVPVYVKTTHDNIPMLCVRTAEAGEAGREAVLNGLRQIFVREKRLSSFNIPARVMLAEEDLPRNGNGKIDLFRISKGEVKGEVFTIEPVRKQEEITNFRLKPYEEGPADMIREVFDGISAELKDSLSETIKQHHSGEEKQMKNANRIFESFNSMNRMGMQMMKNVMGRMGQMNQAQSFGDASNCGMPDMQKMMEGMKQMNQKAAENMKAMNQKAAEAIPGMQGAAQTMAQNMVPVMRQQMNQMISCMEQMNQTAMQMMQLAFDQHCRMLNQIMDGVEQMAGAGSSAGMPEAPAEAPVKAEEPAPEASAVAPKAEKKAANKTSRKKAETE